jgi:lipid-binding SYLF domain-containing protein
LPLKNCKANLVLPIFIINLVVLNEGDTMKKGILSCFGVLFVAAILISGCSKPEEKKAEAPPVQKQTVQEKAPAVKQEMAEKAEPTVEPATMTDKAIDVAVDVTLEQFKKDIKGGDEFLKSAKGVLVFPSVFKAGVGIGGEYGEGALRIGGKTVDYYSTAAASIGFQLGMQTKRIIIVFMQDGALKKFRESKGWEAGVDGSIALVELGAGGTIDTTTIKDPIIGFVFGNKGLMFNLTLEGSKYTKIVR